MKNLVFFAIIILTFFLPFKSSGQVVLMLQPVDSITRFNLKGVEVLAFLEGDTVLQAEGKLLDLQGGLIPKPVHILELPGAEKSYNIFIDMEGYETRMIPFKPTKAMNRNLTDIGEVGLMREAKRLGEVTVTATKVKMYNKGDTLIYNADAFLLPDGSMLDDLIRKLDGVEINRQGEIFVHGQKIESLQLEGRKLFEGDPKTLLENLAAYTVKKIKVYRQEDELDKFLGNKTKNELPLVMDVNLKKEYSVGKWLNVDAGYGTSDRYLGRGFFMGFSKRFALSSFINANNLAAGVAPGKNDNWTMGTGASTDCSYLSGGLNYQYDGDSKKPKARGSVSVNTSKDNTLDGMTRTNFLTSGDTYDFRHGSNLRRSFNVKVYNTVSQLFKDKYYLDLNPVVDFSRNNGRGGSASATFDEDFGSVSKSEIEALYTGDMETLRSHLINREIRKTKNRGDNFNVSLNGSFKIKFPASNSFFHVLGVDYGGKYNNSTSEDFNRFDINYGQDAKPAVSEYAFTRKKPNRNRFGNLVANYLMTFRQKHNLQISYHFRHTDRNEDRDRYLLNQLEHSQLEGLKFGELPSETLLPDVIDPVNSNRINYVDNEQQIGLNGRVLIGEEDLDKKGNWGSLSIALAPEIRIEDRSYSYAKADYHTVAKKCNYIPGGNVSIYYGSFSHKRKYGYTAILGWSSWGNLYDMSYLIDQPNTSDPLNIFVGNPHLKNEYEHSARGELQFRKTQGKWYNNYLRGSYRFTTNHFTHGMVYDPQTGVRTTSMYNVDGEHSYNLIAGSSGEIAKWENKPLKRLTYNASFTFDKSKTVNMTGASEDGLLSRFVYNRNLSPSAGLRLGFGNNHEIGFSASGNFNRYSGDDIAAFSASTQSYSADASFLLPFNIKLRTNINIYCRNGYTDPNLNTTDCIWNASGSWTWKKPNLTLTVDCYDLLHQIRTVSYTVNALARTETWRNTLPHYAMFRISYHFDMSPGKKK